MLNYLKLLWQRLYSRPLDVKSEVDHLAHLQRTAAAKRKEYADAKERAESRGDTLPTASITASRRRMQEAEVAHISALQRWENKQARQRSY